MTLKALLSPCVIGNFIVCEQVGCWSQGLCAFYVEQSGSLVSYVTMMYQQLAAWNKIRTLPILGLFRNAVSTEQVPSVE
jgi:hypothetical protein